MAEINYKITFYSYWHAGSGLTSGSDLDALVIKSKEELPFIPGRTLKGLLKDAALSLREITPGNEMDLFIDKIFGKKNSISAEDTNDDMNDLGQAYFSNAELNSSLKEKISEHKLAPYFYSEISSTAIKQDGIAKPHSLRRMQVTIPVILVASILNVDEAHKQLIANCMSWIKRLGQNRHRGLGRCKFEIINEGGNQ